MSCLRTRWVLLTCAAMATGGALHAQPRAPVPKAAPIELKEQTPSCDANEACRALARSRAAALAWANGLDENGAPLDEGARARRLSEMELWLRRLAGKFRIEGTYRNYGGTAPVRGTADCPGVGDGPGVFCVITATWEAPRERIKDPEFNESIYDAMQPLVIHFGIDPGSLQIRSTLMDLRASKASAFLVDDEVAFSGEVMPSNSLTHYSWTSRLIAIKPGGDVTMKFAVLPTSIAYQLRGVQLLSQGVVPDPWIEFDMQLHREPPVNADYPAAQP